MTNRPAVLLIITLVVLLADTAGLSYFTTHRTALPLLAFYTLALPATAAVLARILPVAREYTRRRDCAADR